MGTGIVFVVLVAIWVAYFVQYWSRRREHLATARSVEAFSEAMRVLERRPVLPAATGDRISTAYAVSPARVVSARPAPRPQVIAKPHAPTKPSPSRGGVSRMPSPQSPSASPRRTQPQRRPSAGRRPQSRPAAVSSSRRVRGLTLLGSLVATLVLAVLVAFSVLLPWAPLVGVAAVVGAFLWVRAGVRAEQEARRAHRARSRQAGQRSRPVHSGRESAASARTTSSSTTAASEVGLAGGAEPLAPAEDPEEAHERPDRWQPVPVPPPTYTLKAKAEHPAATSSVADPVASESSGTDATGVDSTGADAEGTDATATAPVAGPAGGGLTPADVDGGLQEHRTAAYGT